MSYGFIRVPKHLVVSEELDVPQPLDQCRSVSDESQLPADVLGTQRHFSKHKMHIIRQPAFTLNIFIVSCYKYHSCYSFSLPSLMFLNLKIELLCFLAFLPLKTSLFVSLQINRGLLPGVNLI